MRTLAATLTLTFLLMPLCGCSTGPILFGHNDCQSSAEPGSAQWWTERAQAPPGARNVCHKGKMWPVRPRPTGEKQQFTHAYHSQHYWPLPYVCQDRAYVKNISDIIEETAGSAETVNDVANKLLNHVEKLSTTASVLDENMEGLKNEISVFKI